MNQSTLQPQVFCDLAILNRIAADPDVTQSVLAEAVNISIGTVNSRLKTMVENGYVVVEQARRRKLRYIITEEGRDLQSALTATYLQQSFLLYRQVRQQVQDVLQKLDGAGVRAVRLLGDGDVADVCRLTCLEQQISLTDDDSVPTLVVDGLEVNLQWPGEGDDER